MFARAAVVLWEGERSSIGRDKVGGFGCTFCRPRDLFLTLCDSLSLQEINSCLITIFNYHGIFLIAWPHFT